MTIMTVYNVRISRSAMRDMDDLEDFLKSVMSQSGANKYIDNMIAEVQSLSVYADLYRPSTMADHIEDDMVIVDRIRPSKMISK